MESRRYKRGSCLREIHGRKLIYINTVHDSSLLVFIKEFPTRILWYVASKLIREKEIVQAPGDSAITGHLLMGRIGAGSGCSRSSERPDPQDIVVDMILAL
jgi:hypothetical protein